ncbi:MAG: helix-turn-helix domain-containing protein [Gemmatimonas sp.]|nr:helix-turn-helix domain-containing protein [Gemmatimonas sp.]
MMTVSDLNQLPVEEPCAVCGEGMAHRTQRRRAYVYRRRRVMIADDFYRCPTCDETYYAPPQMARAEALAKAALEEQDRLKPKEIRALREKLQLTQFELEDLLGLGRNTVVRWENGQVRPNMAANTLLRLLATEPAARKWLEKWHGTGSAHAA